MPEIARATAGAQRYDRLSVTDGVSPMFVSGITMFLTAPIVGRLMQKVDLRLHHRVGPRHLRARFLADDLDHPRLRFL